MKKQIAIGLIITAFFATAIGLYSCKGLREGEAVAITLKISTPEYLHKLSDYSADTLFLQAVNAAAEKQNADTMSSFISLFGDAWNELAPNRNLASIFATYDLRGIINFDATNAEVIAVLSGVLEHATTSTINNLRLRMDGSGAGRVGIHRIGNSDMVQFRISEVEDPDRLAKLLAQAGRLELWETYYNVSNGVDPGIFEMLLKADKFLYEYFQKDGIDSDVDMYQHPLFTILKPFSDESYRKPIHFPMGGVAAIKDTASVNQMLSIAANHNIFPKNLRFLWSIKSNSSNRAVDLYAIKVDGRSGKAPLDGSVITDAGAIEREWGWSVDFSMNSEGSKIWARMTADNVGRTIAMVMDGRVYSCPQVNSEITGGKSSIMSSFTKEEAEDLAIILKSGELPMSIQLIGKTIEENTAQQ